MKTSNKILVAVDFTENPDDILKKALLLHPEEDTEIILLHVLPEIRMTSIYTESTHPWVDLHKTGIESAKKKLVKYAEHLTVHYPNVSTVVRVGDASERIVQTAEKYNVDCILIGDHCRSGFQHLLHPNVAEHVLRTAKRDVFSFHVPV